MNCEFVNVNTTEADGKGGGVIYDKVTIFVKDS
jgi:hypothetical protein